MKEVIATFGGGCFWCIEAVVQRLKGVLKVESGYTGGHAPGVPTYKEVCSGLTGHAEVVQVTFDPDWISYEKLLTVFMLSHDPTQMNRQGADVGTQYRSVIYFHDEEQKKDIEKVFKDLQPYHKSQIVTEVAPATDFYAAESYHQNYYNDNPDAAYCKVMIDPKVSKLRECFTDLLK